MRITKTPEGRKKGYKVSDESKLKARNSNPDSRAVYTPMGTFISIIEASKATGFAPGMVSYYCQKGEEERAGNRQFIRKDMKSFIEWGFVIPGKRFKNNRAVYTPFGNFSTVTEAAQIEGLTPAAIIHKIKSNRNGYHYVD